jgi:hypothetical protein
MVQYYHTEQMDPTVIEESFFKGLYEMDAIAIY